MELTTIAAALNSMKIAADMTTAIVAIKTDADLAQKHNDLLRKVSDAYMALILGSQTANALAEENRQLRQQLADTNQWLTDSKRYALHQITGGLIVYALKETDSHGDIAHWLCANCYGDKKKSILQKTKKGLVLSIQYPHCGLEQSTGYQSIEAPAYV